ncbi:MAG: tripartite tricarboxylate transporter TctB family protein, partial [Desulfobacterales bacterium]|nr:tripartite tricarboxylate transporter TctB family protein [Desulfobacterales bacterium]
MKEANKPKADFVVSILLVCFGLWVILHAYRMPRFENLNADPFSVPGIVPGSLGVVIMLLGSVVLIRSLRQKGHRLRVDRETLRSFGRDPSMQRMLASLLVCFIYGFVLVGLINYYLATFIFMLAFLILFQYQPSQPFGGQGRLWVASTLQALLTAGLVGAVFRYL